MTLDEAIELHLFGDDLRVREGSEDDICDAIDISLTDAVSGERNMSVRWCGNVYTPAIWASAWTLWKGRLRTPYQQDLEAHVANYRRPARPFDTTRDLLPLVWDRVREAMLVRDFTEAMFGNPAPHAQWSERYFDFVTASPEAQCIAALRAFGVEWEATDGRDH